MLGLNKGEVRLEDGQENYGALFQQEKKKLEEIMGKHVVGIEHFGSTAISGIKAKPIIDILIGLHSLDDVRLFDKQAMARESYYLIGKQNVENKIVYAKFSNLETARKTHFLHVVEYGGEWWNAHLFFRDRLKENPQLAHDYEAVKIDLAKTYANDVEAYTEGKKEFVDQVIESK